MNVVTGEGLAGIDTGLTSVDTRLGHEHKNVELQVPDVVSRMSRQKQSPEAGLVKTRRQFGTDLEQDNLR